MGSPFSVIVGNLNNRDDFAWVVAAKLHDQSPLRIEANRVLSFSGSFEFLEVQRLQFIKVAFIKGTSDLLHTPSIHANDFLRIAGSKLAISLKAI